MRIEHYGDFREFMNRLIEQHAGSVPGVPGTGKKLEGEIREGMEATWRLVLPRFKHNLQAN